MFTIFLLEIIGNHLKVMPTYVFNIINKNYEYFNLVEIILLCYIKKVIK